MSRRPAGWLLLLGLWLLLACDEAKLTKTQVILRVQVADASLLDSITSLRVAVMREDANWVLASQAKTPVLGKRWPLDFPIVPSSAQATDKRFEVIVDALAEERRLTQVRAISSYQVNSLRILEVWLTACPDACADDDCHGEACQSCELGECQPVRVWEPGDLTVYKVGDAPVTTPPGLDAGQPDSGAPAPVDPTGPEPERCPDEGSQRCKGEGSRQREQCSAGSWQDAPACEANQVCVLDGAAAGTCTQPFDACRGAAGGAVCTGATLHSCAADGTSLDALECASARHCEAGVANKKCAPCLPGEYRCTGSRLERCDATQSWQLAMQCPESGEVCNAEAGACTSSLCKAGNFSCGSDKTQLSRCSTSEKTYDPVQTCKAGLCDALGGQCDVCTPGAKDCDGNVSRVCNDDGQAYTMTPCAAPRGTCAGAGSCVACVNDSQCQASTCMVASCNIASGSCASVPAARNSACSNGLCDGAGKCGYCGDNMVQMALGEQCDDGNTVATDSCNACKAASCGDGFVQPGEECDDKNSVNTDMCAGCKNARCGDGFVQPGEQCDDANTVENDGCNACRNPRCGDGAVQTGEQCDDGNTVTTDACVNCQNARCGDGVVRAGVEQCEDANSITTDACIGCQNAYCGDGFVRAGTESCDDGNQINTDTCTNACAAARCGDGFRQGSEQCDDGNQVNNDGCTNGCKTPACGDGITQSGEQCDDGNAVTSDGCIACKTAYCGDGFLRTGSEDCEPGVGGWTTQTCSVNTCKRVAYVPCETNANCPFDETCISSAKVCGGNCVGQTSTDPNAVCKQLPGYGRACYLDACMVPCTASGGCPSGLHCQNMSSPFYPLFQGMCISG